MQYENNNNRPHKYAEITCLGAEHYFERKLIGNREEQIIIYYIFKLDFFSSISLHHTHILSLSPSFCDKKKQTIFFVKIHHAFECLEVQFNVCMRCTGFKANKKQRARGLNIKTA